MKLRFWNIQLVALGICLMQFPVMGAAATRTSKQSAVQSGTMVRTKVAATGLYSEECYNAYYGCMDQFCISDNINGGSCSCSDDNAKYEDQLAAIKKQLIEANDIRTLEVERINAGAQADIIFSGERQYDKDGNVIKSTAEPTAEENKAKKKADLLSLFNSSYDDEDIWAEETVETVADKKGQALYTFADGLCRTQMPANCSKDMTLLTQMYSRQIVSDCTGFANEIAKQQTAADLELADARADVRGALMDSFNTANKYDRGTCMVEFKKCMQTEDACGADWKNCVHIIASENMQNDYTNNGSYFEITNSTMQILETKRNICEKVLNQCQAVRDMVWPDFLREAAPTIKLAERNAESKLRMSCLTDISDCIQKACRDDIVGKGVDSMDSCLSRPEMVQSFCKIQIDTCTAMEPEIWGYVKDKLAAMRVDACTAEVKECFTSEDRCGENFANCVGMDYEYIHDICPIDKLVVCKANNPKFSMNDLDSMLMGIYLNVDNSLLENCQNLVDAKMEEVCGSTTDCNKFAADDTIGTGSLRTQKDGTTYRVTGMISFGSIKMGTASSKATDRVGNKTITLKPGEISIAGYLEKVREQNAYVANSEGIMSSIEEELNNIAGTINRTIEMIEQDPEIQFCIKGRNLSQITGKNETTGARFPNLLNQVKMQIAVSALRQAQDNYNAKFNTAIADATKDASLDIAQYMCQMMPQNGGVEIGGTSTPNTPLAPPYAISYDIATGMTVADLTKMGSTRVSTQTSGTAVLDSTKGASKVGDVIGSLTGLGGNKVRMELPGGSREMWSIFSRDTRTCHYCTSTVTKKCSSVKKKGFLGIGAKSSLKCEESAPVEECRDIVM